MLLLLTGLMTLLGAFGAYFFKKTTGNASGLLLLLQSPWLYLGGGFYVAGALLNVLLLRYMDYSVLYPMTAITYIWTLFISRLFLREKITGRKMLGVLCICAGVFVLTR